MLTPGQITFCVMAKQDANQLGDFATAAIGLARSADRKQFGYISEYHGNVAGKEVAEALAKRTALEMCARRLKLNSEESDALISQAIGASVNARRGEWACTVALCVFVL